MGGAVSTTKEAIAPLVYKYAFFDKPLPYRALMLVGAACLGIAVLYLFGSFFFGLEVMASDEARRPWWTQSKVMIPIAVAGTIACTLAQLLL